MRQHFHALSVGCHAPPIAYPTPLWSAACVASLVALKNRLKVCSNSSKFFTQLVYNFLIYTLSPIYQHTLDEARGEGREGI